MKSFLRIVFALIACMCISFGPVVHAQSPEPPLPPQELDYKFDQGRFEPDMRASGSEERRMISSDEYFISTDNTILATAGPDDFGYIWDDSVPLAWIDASGGTTVGGTGDANSNPYGPYPLPFSFKFYENTYSQVNISQNGYVTFGTDYFNQNRIPSPESPNNQIAPYAVPAYLDTGSWVRYMSGGTAPNRYFVVEWHDLRGGPSTDSIGGDDKFRFETVIYENGNILFQYQTMTVNGSAWCASSGIENQYGTDGLAYFSYCNSAPSNKAVLFTRPAPSARVSLYPDTFEALAGTHQLAEYKVLVRNTGELGSDVYDMALTSVWAGTLYDESGATLLTDTDGDSLPDTGPVSQSGEVIITVKIEPSTLAAVGDYQTALLNATSSLDTSKFKQATFKTVIPAPFAQLFDDSDPLEMTLALIQPTMNAEQKITTPFNGDASAVVEAPNGNFIYASHRYRCLDTTCTFRGSEVYFSIQDHAGRTVLPATQVTNNYGASKDVYDRDPTIAVTPNGNISIMWQRQIRDSVTGQSTNNLFLAVLDSSGKFLKNPTNLTNNTDTGGTYFSPYAVAATGDNRFHLTWSKYQYTVSTEYMLTSYLGDIYFMAVDSSGTTVCGLTKMTADTWATSDGFDGANIKALQNNRTLLLWRNWASQDIDYSIMDSAGNVISGPSNLTGDGFARYERNPSAVQLPNGEIFVAWNGTSSIWYAILNSSYQRIFGPAGLNSSGADYDGAPSVTTDSASHAILTWGDSNLQNNLFYSLVDSSGTVLTQPMIFRSAVPDDSIYNGNVQSGNTTFSWTPPADVDTWVQSDPLVIGSSWENVVESTVQYGNDGFTPTSSTVLQATLDPNLTLLASQVTPASQVGNVYTWNISDLNWLDSGQLYIIVSYPYAAPGTQYPIEWTITSAGTEDNPTDNTFTSYVVVPHKVYLPLIKR